MFTKKNDPSKSQKPTAKKDPPVVKYPQPKILLIDMTEDVETGLRAKGLNITTGSFGTPYTVPKSNNLQPVIPNGYMPPNYTEQEIVIIDLTPKDPLSGPIGEKPVAPGTNDWWTSCEIGVIDPRARVMLKYQSGFDRILDHGGIFMVFADARKRQKQAIGFLGPYSDFMRERDLDLDNWMFLSQTESHRIEIKPDRGEVINTSSSNSLLSLCLAQHTIGGSFACTFRPVWNLKDWVTLATNKFGASVAGAWMLGNQEHRGLVLLFPRVSNRPEFVSKMINEVLPEISPSLFPHYEGAKWVQRPDYEIPQILQLKSQISEIEKRARAEKVELEETIVKLRSEYDFIHDLIRETGEPLVSSVKKALDFIGFKSVIDVDEQAGKLGDTGPRREDLQIHDYSPAILVEVKGISNLPRETYTLQVWKYLAPRMKEWKRTDIRGLSIVNHQRNLPALERENQSPFQPDVLTNAKEQGFGLLTTWDLFRLIRNYIKNDWRHEHVKDLFYQDGRIEPTPSHYHFLGEIKHFWDKVQAIAVQVEQGEIQIGDRLAFELPIEFEEQIVESLQIDNKSVEQAIAGMLVAMKTTLTKEQAKEGTRVYLVK